MERLRIGVIGLGWFGEIHCETIVGVPNLELAALCTRTPERLSAMAGKFGVQKTYRDYHDLLADPEIDAVSIVTMWDQHQTRDRRARGGQARPRSRPAGLRRVAHPAIASASFEKPKFFGGDERDRTVGLLSAIQALSQLSYIPITLDRSVERGAILRSGGRNATDRFRSRSGGARPSSNQPLSSSQSLDRAPLKSCFHGTGIPCHATRGEACQTANCCANRP